MRKTGLVMALWLLSAVIVSAQTRRREAPPPADAASPEAIVAALYASVSHAPDASPNWERMRNIFLPVGMLVPPRKPDEAIFTVVDVDGFEERYKKSVAAAKEKGGAGPTGFFEKELSRRTDCFGNVCQIFSTYESRHTESDAQPFVRGINSIQLVHDDQRWWIASVVWDTERAGNPIPPSYLPAAKQ